MKGKITLLVAILLLQLVPLVYAQGTDSGLNRIWIADDTTRQIYEFTTNWELLSRFGSPLNISVSAIAIDPTTDPRSLWVVGEFPGRLINLTKNGETLSIIETQVPFTAWGPEGVDVDPLDSSIWFVTDPNYLHNPPDPGVPAVYNIGKDSTFISSFQTSAFDIKSTSPQSIAVDPVDGTLWVADNSSDEIYHVTNQGVLIASLDTRGLIPSVDNPQGITIAIDKSNGTLWLTDRTTFMAFNITREGELLSSFDLSSIDLGPFTIFNPTGIAFERVVVQHDLGEASDFAVLGLAGAKIKMEGANPGVVGEVGLGPNGEQDLMAGFIAGTLVVDPTAENKDPETAIEGGIEVKDLYQAAADARNASEDAANLTPTLTLNEIKETQTIAATGQLTVVEVKKIELKDGQTLTLSGGLADQFIINVSEGLKLENGSVIQLTGGLQAGNVLFNFAKRDARAEIKSGSIASGIFLAPGKDAIAKIEHQGTTVMGAVIAGKEISIKENARVIFFGETIDNGVDLNEAGVFSVFGLSGSKIKMEDGNPGIVGEVGLGPRGVRDLKAGFIQGKFIMDPTAKTENAVTTISGDTREEALSLAVADALHASSDAANLTPTLALNEIKETQTIAATGQLTVVEVKKIELKDGKTLTLSGGLADQFIINVSEGLKLENGSVIQLTEGLQVGNVLFNFVKRDAQAEIKSGSIASGIFLAPGKDATAKIEHQGTTVMGAVIAGKEISIKKNAQVISAN